MEELLKSLQGKSMTKKSLFDFLSEINLEELSKEKPKNTIVYDDIVIHPIKEEIVEEKRKGRKPKDKQLKETTPLPEFKCEECMKICSTQITLDNHYKNVSVCKKWIDLPKKPNMVKLTKGIHLIIDDLLEKAITDDNKLECKFCNYTFSTKGNLHKHFNTSTLCNIMACDEFKNIVHIFNSEF